ncbi:carbon starvation protein A [Nitratidesulfovibrio sp. SRB-5]|uniref:Carbon starvation protein CstA n=1 Tax=Nitratidesulfovibrio vulgaris (strain DSM 19637 / Miyazaki F) TaxID=883 RepID=B8DLB6_NITV9|nr:carbon starvation protein A [Nitratidesulfovibrio sp. SRB-5]MBZ2172574.1 carbon starvation protein A [Nitratidesulfovibrio sp. SRB-5]RXF77452.1 carbon starvation protein A [Desulfovibrio sp. DS-1]
MNALTLVFAALCVFAIAYRFYGLFLTRTVLGVKPGRPTPAVRMADGHDYVETNKYVLFGHHFAAIAAAGPLLGPVLAAQFGYLPGTLWILVGCVVAGAVHDTVVLFASVRHKGQSLAYIASKEIDKFTGSVASFAVLFILILTLAGLSIAVVNAMHDSAWGTFTVFATIPIALLMGVYLHVWRDGDVKGASIIGVVLLALAILAGPYVVEHPVLSSWFNMSRHTIALSIPVYGFAASVLPVWLLLCPRDYLSTYLKIGTIAALAVGIFWVHPTLQMEAITPFVNGGGPIIPGAVFPFLFITIACGALSGFHAIIATGTTPKMIGNERDLLFVGYGAMLTEGFVAIMALIAACVLVPADYFAINSAPAVYAKLGMTPVDLPHLAQAVGENIQGRPGGAVSLAVGMAHIFSSIPFMEHLMSYWYHFAIMFEAVFILTAVDTGTRVGRFFLQEMIGTVVPKFAEKRWMPGILITSALFTASWGYLVYTGDISTIWPLFGMSNQLLAAVGLLIGTTMIIRMNKAKYAWMTAIPGLSMVVITFWAGYLNVMNNYLPKGLYLLSSLAIIVMCLMAVVIVGTVKRWMQLLAIQKTVTDEDGEEVLQVVTE